MTPLKLLVIVTGILVLSIVAATPLYASSHLHHEQKCRPPYSVLYSYTFPVTKECLLLTHYGHIVNASGATIK
jgi:hypothetical protein